MMTGKKETTGNGVAQYSVAFSWASVSSAATFRMSCAAATTTLHHSNADPNGSVVRALPMETTTSRATERVTVRHPPPTPGGTPTPSTSGTMMASCADATTAARRGNAKHDSGAAIVTVAPTFCDT